MTGADRLTQGVLNDWERLKKQESNLRAIYEGRDLLREIERANESRDEWMKIAMANQSSTKVKPATEG